ncbi:hypothetical protein F4553_007598 [Allocatelliglobosispora scoriae]|uniref:CARDB domain-containing protein n=1 Tax=Allocatelliglobosispora scoriae TaxID=643052 RepID=A0A841C1C4_9ACTN|nr:hypothetical protein [Allocatelliglobosispora scoriae]MBB5874164.1 hypothetical protein [Allocatelliglobosispora scoriae]
MRLPLIFASVCLLATLGLVGCGDGPDLPPASINGTPWTAASASPVALPAATQSPLAAVSPAVATSSAPPLPDLAIVAVGECQVEAQGHVNGVPTSWRVHYGYEVTWTHDPPFAAYAVATTTLAGQVTTETQRRLTSILTTDSLKVFASEDIGPTSLGRPGRLRFVVDPKKQIAESDEGNNSATLIFNFPAALSPETGRKPLPCTVQ